MFLMRWCHSDQVIKPRNATRGSVGSKVQPLWDGYRFDNPWGIQVPAKEGLVSWEQLQLLVPVVGANKIGLPKSAEELDRVLPVRRISRDCLDRPGSGLRMAWLGHASCLVDMDGMRFLTDPIFSNLASSTQLFGPRRYRPVPCQPADLAPVDVVVLS